VAYFWTPVHTFHQGCSLAFQIMTSASHHRTDPLLQPLTINGMTLRNRIFSSAHAPAGYLEGGKPGLRYALYQEEKARGGIGLTMFGGSSFVASDSYSHFGAIDAGTDEVVPFYTDLAERVHRHGSRTIVQITHLGRRGNDRAGDWLPTLSPSGVRERAHRSFPKAMEDFDFPRVLEAYASAAERARRGGLDGVEIAGLAGHLVDQFLARRSNLRTDEYGGDLEHRMRFLREVVDEVRKSVGSDFVVGVRIPGDEGVPGGLAPDECVEIARALSETGLVDYFNIVYGGGFTHRELADIIPPTGRELGAHLSVAARIRATVTQPVLHAGRVADLATARHAIREGMVDLIGMTRAHIADPHVVRKLEAGEEERIRPCVGASMCISGAESFCIHNPATGRESYIPQLITPAAVRRRVVVVGGGPAGLEAARACAERGHQVTLFEAGSHVGGQVLLMSRPHRQSEKRSITEWLAAEARLAGAELRVNRYVEAEDVLALEPDVVVVATGGMPLTELPEGGEELVESASDVLTRAPGPARSVLVFDDHGDEHALVAVEHLVDGGHEVEVVTVDAALGQEVGHTVMPDYLRRFYAAGVTTTPHHELRGVRRLDGRLEAVLRNTHTDQLSTRVVDRVVVEQGSEPFTEVYDELRDRSTNRGRVDLLAFARGLAQPLPEPGTGAFAVFRIGDAVSHRGVHAALFDARRLSMNL